MLSEKKREANRHNALRSTGPRTPEGKQAAAQNAVTHGLLSRETLLPGEDNESLNALRAELVADLDPRGTLETLWVDAVVACVWKLRRVNVLERGVIELHVGDRRADATARKRTPAEELALALIRDGHGGDQVGKLARYQTMLERMLVRALHELERRQAGRQGTPVAPPVAVDVTVSRPDVDGEEGVDTRRAEDIEVRPVRNEPTAEPIDAVAGGVVPNEPTVMR